MTTLARYPKTGHDPALELAPVKRRRVLAPQPGAGQRLAFSVYEAAEQLGETADMVQTFCRTEKFPRAYIGGRGGRTSPWRIPTTDQTDFMKKRGTTR